MANDLLIQETKKRKECQYMLLEKQTSLSSYFLLYKNPLMMLQHIEAIQFPNDQAHPN